MKLKSFGCSFIYGNELSDTNSPDVYSKLTWPALLAKHFDYDYECYAQAGRGNLFILENIISQVNLLNDESAFFAINWTWADRFDYTQAVNDKWTSILPVHKSEVASVYNREIHSQYRDKLSTLSYIKLAADILEQNNLPYIMTNMESHVFEERWHQSEATKFLQRAIKDKITTFDGLNFLDWSRKNGYPVSKLWHPLDQAHCAASEFLINKVNS